MGGNGAFPRRLREAGKGGPPARGSTLGNMLRARLDRIKQGAVGVMQRLGVRLGAQRGNQCCTVRFVFSFTKHTGAANDDIFPVNDNNHKLKISLDDDDLIFPLDDDMLVISSLDNDELVGGDDNIIRLGDDELVISALGDDKPLGIDDDVFMDLSGVVLMALRFTLHSLHCFRGRGCTASH
jgi:hypothetical protein